MSNKDEFELDVEDTEEESFDDVSLDEEIETPLETTPKQKKSGGGLIVTVLLLAVLGGGSFAAVKFLGVQLPFDVPGLTQTAQVPVSPQPTAEDARDTMTTSADLPMGDLPPQPAVPADSITADAGNLPFGIPDAAPSEDAPTVNAPWGMEETPAAAAEAFKKMPVETFDDGAQADTQADSGNIIDPFAMMGAQDVTDAVNAPEATTSAPVQNDIVDPFAAAPVTAAATAAPTTAPTEDTGAKAHAEALEKKLAVTEKSLADAEKALKQANDELAKKSAALAQAQADLKTAQADAKAAAKTAATAKSTPAVATKQTGTAAAPTAEKKPVAAQPAAPARKVDWVLRSAKPGMAWVSEKGSSEMRTVSVGDTLAGIGKVTAIATDAQGRWFVNGTRGSINQ
ncbi:MAG: hypothetical protein ACK4PK_11565 [Alphaproteobacteria bacterium]